MDLDEKPPRDSSFRLEISIAVGYQRKRAVLGGKWEGHLVTGVLLLGSAAVVVLVVMRVLQLGG